MTKESIIQNGGRKTVYLLVGLVLLLLTYLVGTQNCECEEQVVTTGPHLHYEHYEVRGVGEPVPTPILYEDVFKENNGSYRNEKVDIYIPETPIQ